MLLKLLQVLQPPVFVIAKPTNNNPLRLYAGLLKELLVRNSKENILTEPDQNNKDYELTKYHSEHLNED